MCGIAGIFKWGEEPISEDIIAILLAANEHRGNDASGLVIQQADGSLNVLKKDVPAWKLASSEEYEQFIKDHLKPDSTTVLVHARGASQGNPRDNNNNHPIFAGLGAIVHNGSIKNDDTLFNQLHLERKAKTDSDIFRAIVDKHGITERAIHEMGKCVGSGAIAGIHPAFPGKLLLVRSGNPLTLASNDDFLFFSSEKNTLHKACRPFINRKGMWFQTQRPNVDFANMSDHTGWVIGFKGLEKHVECRICSGSYIEPWRKTYEEYEERQEKWNRLFNEALVKNRQPQDGKKIKLAYCPSCKMEWVIPLDEDYSDYSCNKKKGGCGKTLVAPIVAAVSNLVN